ncbi:hypothetical protein NIK97_20575 [Brucella pseudintermedia]|uniref:Uncharacterized protein n=1 Tax=Brucella pseudintermedia TaxID=370111 RepID=A0ABY5UIQ9_9HYPH|nr:hypothetical protein [Brucella pseudintermedia]UWL62247.1 hypothetical protein NIK97_20575 [Brucella pseudintermedia]
MVVGEHAVKAAQKAYRECEGDSTESHRAALTAAPPFLPVQGAVKVKPLPWKDTGDSDQGRNSYAQTRIGRYEAFEMRLLKETIYGWSRGHGDEKADSFEAAKAAAQADYEARILSVLEPSTARELALEEGYRQGIEAAAQKAAEMLVFADTTSTADREIPAAIRALSSPDHADAGKVEGDGNRETLWKSAARNFGAYLASNGTPYAIDYWNECFGPLFSAPSEGAE